MNEVELGDVYENNGIKETVKYIGRKIIVLEDQDGVEAVSAFNKSTDLGTLIERKIVNMEQENKALKKQLETQTAHCDPYCFAGIKKDEEIQNLKDILKKYVQIVGECNGVDFLKEMPADFQGKIRDILNEGF